ncbi:hypothetical protein Q4555_06005 [Octadecabacter sp. 1_MG-2023]|uniref:hypothetical protein n=1 Tax=unclassified Octadecabacter TaxID=196158 RepID=UPI001C080CD5|nr:MULTISPECIES: hypothetical protein [unclassified Octadecabacter]MBU2994494.1 hypothetical protein [Octadecabacter sp. B2R22]MDO6734213.1 hypothetical protein [Octadecabacter sp. 1_MG-2023]
MPVEFNIFPERGLVVVRYSGYASVNDTLTASEAYVSHPDYASGQKQLVDMTRVTGFEKDHVQFMEMQARKAERLAHSGLQSLVVYIAPTATSRDLSSMFVRSWADVDAVVPLVQHSETEALALLGQQEENIDILLATLAK